MQANRRRVELLRRLERLREVEKREAARRVAEAQDAQGKLEALGLRSGEITASYAARRDAGTGADLARFMGITRGLARIGRETASEQRKAAQSSQHALAQLQQATRKRDATSDRLNAERQMAERLLQAREAANQPGLARKLKG